MKVRRFSAEILFFLFPARKKKSHTVPQSVTEYFLWHTDNNMNEWDNIGVLSVIFIKKTLTSAGVDFLTNCLTN